MRIIAWNCHGLGNPRSVRALYELVKIKDPHVVFLSETKLHVQQMERIRRRCGFKGCFAVDADGTRGGLAMLWTDDFDLNLISFSVNHIDMEVKKDDSDKWRLTGIYAVPEVGQRNETWSLLCRLAEQRELPWLCIGDFNEILWNKEKTGPCLRRSSQMEAFRETLDHCELIDLGYTGSWFTWERGRSKQNNVRERLDRGVATSAWINMFPGYEVLHLPCPASDHKPILLKTETSRIGAARRKRRRQCFEAAWLKKEGVDDVVNNFWREFADQSLGEKLKGTGLSLKKWHDENFGNSQIRMTAIQKEIEAKQQDPITDEKLSEIKSLEDEYLSLLEKEETFWRQRSRFLIPVTEK